MRLAGRFSQVSFVSVSLCLVVTAGCSTVQTKLASLTGKDQSKTAPSAVADKQSWNILNRNAEKATPSSAVVPVVAEEKLTDEKKSNVTLALGQMLEEVGKLNEAQAYYEQALKHDPKSLKAALALARVYAQLGRPDAALKTYEQAEKLHGKQPSLYNDKGLFFAEQSDFPHAIETLRHAVKLDPTNSKYHNNLGMALALADRYDESWQEFRDGVGPGTAHYNVALMLHQAGRTTEARDHLERALATLPKTNTQAIQAVEAMLTHIDSDAASVATSPVESTESESTVMPEVSLPPQPAEPPVEETLALDPEESTEATVQVGLTGEIDSVAESTSEPACESESSPPRPNKEPFGSR